MKKVGITGGIGAGKSIVCDIFQLLGIPNYSADNRAKWLQVNDPTLRKEITSLFGKQAYLNDDTLNRAYIGDIVFNDLEKLASLNALVHPAVAKDFKEWCKKHTDKPFVLKEAALLFETGSYKNLDANILVLASEEIRLTRVLKRDSQRSKEDVKKIMDQQMGEDKKIALANYLIYNDESSSLIKQCVELYHTLKA